MFADKKFASWQHWGVSISCLTAPGTTSCMSYCLGWLRASKRVLVFNHLRFFFLADQLINIQVQNAVEFLKMIGALDENENLTDLGTSILHFGSLLTLQNILLLKPI